MRITVAISGASGSNLGVNFVKQIPKDIEVFVIFSKSAKTALKLENGISANKLFEDCENITVFKDSNIGASIASGSFKVDKMIILPCSMNLPGGGQGQGGQQCRQAAAAQGAVVAVAGQ